MLFRSVLAVSPGPDSAATASSTPPGSPETAQSGSGEAPSSCPWPTCPVAAPKRHQESVKSTEKRVETCPKPSQKPEKRSLFRSETCLVELLFHPCLDEGHEIVGPLEHAVQGHGLQQGLQLTETPQSTVDSLQIEAAAHPKWHPMVFGVWSCSPCARRSRGVEGRSLPLWHISTGSKAFQLHFNCIQLHFISFYGILTLQAVSETK